MLLIRALIAHLPPLSERIGLDGDARTEMETWLPRDSLRHRSSARGCRIWGLFLFNPDKFFTAGPFQPLCLPEVLTVTSHRCKGREGSSLQAHILCFWSNPKNVIYLINYFLPVQNQCLDTSGHHRISDISKCRPEMVFEKSPSQEKFKYGGYLFKLFADHSLGNLEKERKPHQRLKQYK